MAARVVKGKPSLDRWESEKPHMHRALLLFTMQDKGSSKHYRSIEGRAIAPVAKALGHSKTSVWRWCESRDWRLRIRHHGTDAQRYAIELYRRLYLGTWVDHDMAFVGGNISIPLNEPAISVDSKEEVVRVMRAITPDPPAQDIQDKAQKALENARQVKLDETGMIQATVVDALEVCAQSLKAALDPKWASLHLHVVPARVKPGELPALHQLLSTLNDERSRLENPEIAQAGTRAAVDSVRVRIAKETGGDLAEAVLDDCQEVIAILTQQRQPARSFQSVENERQQEEADASGDHRHRLDGKAQ